MQGAPPVRNLDLDLCESAADIGSLGLDAPKQTCELGRIQPGIFAAAIAGKDVSGAMRHSLNRGTQFCRFSRHRYVAVGLAS